MSLPAGGIDQCHYFISYCRIGNGESKPKKINIFSFSEVQPLIIKVTLFALKCFLSYISFQLQNNSSFNSTNTAWLKVQRCHFGLPAQYKSTHSGSEGMHLQPRSIQIYWAPTKKTAAGWLLSPPAVFISCSYLNTGNCLMRMGSEREVHWNEWNDSPTGKS